MADIIFVQKIGDGFKQEMKEISGAQALELLQKHRAARRRDSNPPAKGSFLEILFESSSEIPSELAEEFEKKRYLLYFDEPDVAMKIYKEVR